MVSCLAAGQMTRALMTRGERAIVTKHLLSCPKCRDDALAFAVKLVDSLSLVHSVSSLMFAHRQMMEDANDPDFAKVIHG